MKKPAFWRLLTPGVPVLLVGLTACQQDLILEVQLPEPEAELVVNSLFHPDSLWAVYVNTDTRLLGTAHPDAVTGARVEILDGDRVIEVLPYDRTFSFSGFQIYDGVGDFHEGTVARYRSASLRPEVGRTYGIRVTADGYNAVTGSGSVPAHVPILAGTYRADVATDQIGTLDEVRITFDDPPGEANFYNLRVHTRGLDKATGFVGTLAYGFTVVSDLQDDFFGADPDDFLGDNDIFEVKEDGVTFSDAFFDGKRKEIVLQVRGGSPCGFSSSQDQVCQTVVELSAVTEAFYRYHRTLQLQNEAAENPFAEPVRILSNMDNEMGVFAGYNTALWIHERPLGSLEDR